MVLFSEPPYFIQNNHHINYNRPMKDNTRLDVVINLTRTIVLTLLQFITFPWICRMLGDAMVGSFTWALTFVSYFLVIARIGIPNLAVRECIKVRDDKEKLSNKVQMFFIMQSIATIASFILLTIVVLSLPALHSNDPANLQSLIFIYSINLVAAAFSFEWVFIALEKQFYMSVRNIATTAINAILVIIFVTNPGDVYIYAGLSVLNALIGSIINVFYLKDKVSFKKTLPYNFKEYLPQVMVIFVITLSLVAYNQTDSLILGFLNPDKSEVGSYSVGIKGIDIIIGIISNLSSVFVPRANYYYGVEDKKYFKKFTKYSLNIAVFIILPAIVTMMVLAKQVSALISGNTLIGYEINTPYSDSYIVLMLLATMTLTYTLSEMIYGQILLPMKKEKIYLRSLFVGLILNIVLSMLFGGLIFKDRPAIGVALATMITDLLIFVYLLINSWSYMKEALFNKNTLKLGVSILSITISSIILSALLPNLLKGLTTTYQYVLEIVIILGIDSIIYLGVLSALKEDLVNSIVSKIKAAKNK